MSGYTVTLRLSLQGTIALLCGTLFSHVALAADSGHEGHDHAELSPTVITAVAPSSPLTIVTNRNEEEPS